MIKKVISLVIALSVGCATTIPYVGPDGRTRRYHEEPGEVFRAASSAVALAGWAIETSDRLGGVIVAQDEDRKITVLVKPYRAFLVQGSEAVATGVPEAVASAFFSMLNDELEAKPIEVLPRQARE